jgi:3-dehydroquinate synthase
VDGDDWLAAHWGRPVAGYFAAGEEPLFRAREVETYAALSDRDGLVIATGGGALLNPRTRARLERGGVLVALTAPAEVLAARLDGSGPIRPLLAGDTHRRLGELLRERSAHYASFPCQVETANRPIAAVAAAVLELFETAQAQTRFELGPTSAYYGYDLLARLPGLAEARGLRPPFVLIADENVAAVHGALLSRAASAPLLPLPSGEAHKTLETVAALYQGCVANSLERGGTILALGGGVAGDVAGFVAATYMRGVAWVNAPTTVLAMADAALGGKVGVDLPAGKNLVGAFHPPRLVAADFGTLATLPEVEVRCGLAEIIKSGIIGDPVLFAHLAAGKLALEAGIVRAAAVKTGIVNADPFERGERAVLNLGHTIGHGVEAASGFALRHGEAIAIGLAAEARLAERIGLAEPGLASAVADCLAGIGLPVCCPGLDPDAIQGHMRSDKKKVAGRLRFALPRRIGDVVWGVELDPAGEAYLAGILREITNDRS